MSHISTTRGLVITDLAAVRMAAETLGMVWTEKPTYRWYGFSVGDSAVPAGFTADEMGKNAVLVLSVPPEKDPSGQAYEAGIVPDPANPGQYLLTYDNFAGGYGLMAYLGDDVEFDTATGQAKVPAPRFTQHYRMALDRLEALALGDQISFVEQPDGSWESYTIPNPARVEAAAAAYQQA